MEPAAKLEVTDRADERLRKALVGPLSARSITSRPMPARGFYEKLGYTCFGELPDYPVGFSRYFMKKALSEPGYGG